MDPKAASAGAVSQLISARRRDVPLTRLFAASRTTGPASDPAYLAYTKSPSTDEHPIAPGAHRRDVGTTGQAILRAIVAGERDAVRLAQWRHPACHSSEDTIAKALTGDWKEEQWFVLKQSLEL